MTESQQSRVVALPLGGRDEVIEEQPLILKIGDEELVTMRTPGHDEELARGFLLSERLVPDRSHILAMRPFKKDSIDALAIDLSPGLKARGGRLTRVHEIRASCGLCGVPTIDGIAADLPALKPARPRLSLADLCRASALMSEAQTLFSRTGGAHAAALVKAGELCLVREDVGRHNAVDKVLGAAVERGLELSECILTLSGRAGFELIMKGLRLGVPVMTSVSAPTSFAVALAEEAGATLVGFVRGDRGTVYCDDGRLI